MNFVEIYWIVEMDYRILEFGIRIQARGIIQIYPVLESMKRLVN